MDTRMVDTTNDDPRKLRVLIDRVAELAQSRFVPSVVAGLAAREGDLDFPEFVSYLQSALRVEDGIFRMTRERAVLHLADVDTQRAGEVLDRLLAGFRDEFPSSSEPDFEVRLLEVESGPQELSVKAVLTHLFAPRPHTLH